MDIRKTVLTEKEAAEYIGMSRSWLRQSRCLKFHHAPSFVRAGHFIRYRTEDLDVWKAQYATSRDRYRRNKRARGGQAGLSYSYAINIFSL
jgi:predicted DNA-binding transcriptional regulator AlpA